MGILSDENAMCDEHYRNDNCDQCPVNYHEAKDFVASRKLKA